MSINYIFLRMQKEAVMQMHIYQMTMQLYIYANNVGI